tara:strand:+ start:455 stop:637 length:183 start_codon:yes stop_codon:yes gene_type:complete
MIDLLNQIHPKQRYLENSEIIFNRLYKEALEAISKTKLNIKSLESEELINIIEGVLNIIN